MMYTKITNKNDNRPIPKSDEDVEKFLKDGTVTGDATFEIYMIFRKQNPETPILDTLLKTMNYVVSLQ